jgi:hypothetical protein
VYVQHGVEGGVGSPELPEVEGGVADTGRERLEGSLEDVVAALGGTDSRRKEVVIIMPSGSCGQLVGCRFLWAFRAATTGGRSTAGRRLEARLGPFSMAGPYWVSRLR